MSKVFRIVGISGSLRKESWNTKLLKAFAVAANDAEFVKKGVHFEIADWSKLPVYNGDLEADVPAPVLEFKKTIAAADGIIIVTPEYNYSMPGALKNAIDWASRPTYGGPNAWRGKIVGIAGVGPQSYEGAHGGLLAAVALRQSTMFLEWRVIDSPKIHVLKAAEKFTEDGQLKPEEELLWNNIRVMLREVVRTGELYKQSPVL